jgi:hypothetical protein
VEDLEDEVAGLAHVLTNWKVNSKLSKILSKEKNAIDEHKEAIKSIQNNRKLFVTIEFNSLTKSWVSRAWNSISWKANERNESFYWAQERRHFSIKERLEVKSLET